LEAVRALFSRLLDDKRSVVLISLALTALVFGNTFGNEWAYDDVDLVVENADSRSFSAFLENHYPGRPIRELTYIVDHKLFGEEPAGYHVQQILWHAVNGFLLFLLARLLGIQPLWALLGMAFFLVHPLQAESVASVGHRKELLPLFFGLLSLLAWIWAKAAPMPRRIGLLFLCAAAYVVALLSNVTAASLPCVIMLYDHLFVDEEKRFFFRKPFIAEIVGLGALTALFFYYVDLANFERNATILYVQNGFIEAGPHYVLALALLKAFSLYIFKIFIPVELAPEYAFEFSKSLLQWQAWLGLALLASIVAAFFATRRRAPALAFGLAWYLVLYAPVSNVFPSAYIMADRYMYLCLPGVSLAIAALLQGRASQKLAAIGAAVVLLFSILTSIQNTHWRDDHALATRAVAVSPNSSGANWLLAQSATRNGEYGVARTHFRKVLDVNRFFMPAYLHLGRVEERLGDHRSALESYDFLARYGAASDPAQAALARRHAALLRQRLREGEESR
jgi:tetratricopeptide (TPR) repeat protein